MFFKRVASSARTPDGYRLVALQEIKERLDSLNAQGLLSMSRTTRVLDGILCGHAELPVTQQLLADLKVDNMLIIRLDGASGNNTGVLRRDLYSIALKEDRRENALRFAWKFKDIEVLYWLQHSSSPSQLEKLKEWFLKSSKLCSPDFHVVCSMLLNDNHEQKEMEVALDYALQCEESVEYAIAVAEIVLDACSKQYKMNIVHKLIQRIASSKVDAARGDAKHTALLTKLLAASPPPPSPEDSTHIVIKQWFPKLSPEDSTHVVIKQWFPKLLSEACSRRYSTLVTELHKIASLEADKEIIDFNKKNEKGETPLHSAAAYGHVEMVKMLLQHHLSLKEGDNNGRTPLHLAAQEGQVEMVKCLLENGSDPLQERDISGKTALHYAVTCTKVPDDNTVKQLVDVIMRHYEADKNRALLLFNVSAPGIGCAEEIGLGTETRSIRPDVKEHLKDIGNELNKTAKTAKLLLEAATTGNPILAWEFLNRSGNKDQMRQMPQNMRKQIEKYMEQGIERPTYIDSLGREALAECVAEHFLNSHIKSPINVCISGRSGMGKSSLMQQIKAYLQITYSQLFFPCLWKYEDLSGERISPSKKGAKMLREIQRGIIKLMNNNEDIGYGSPEEEKKELVQFLERYRPEHEAVYKSLACMDFAQLLEKNEDEGYLFQGQRLGSVPRVLTVDFDAGMYLGKHEAWAGLALKITEAIEESMTWDQRLSTRWRNARRDTNKNTDFVAKFILPGVLLTFVGFWVAYAAWLLLDRLDDESLKDLKYGSIPATILGLVWGVVGSVGPSFRSVSTQMNDYFKVRDYSQELSYQEQVISDIQFLRKEIGRKPLPVFSLIAVEKWKNWFGLLTDKIKDTSIPKYGSAPEEKLQIIAFVDDLDHCEDEAVLKVLWSTNLIFRECDINFILAADETTLQRAFRNSTQRGGEESADEFIGKIIQLPVTLPDPADDEWEAFLQEELGLDFGSEKKEIEIKYKASASNQDKDSYHRDADRREILSYEGCIPCSYSQLITPKGCAEDVEAGSNQSENGNSSLFQKIRCWIGWFLCILYYRACNIVNENVKDYVNEEDLKKSKELSKRMLEVRGSLTLAYNEVEIQTFDKLRKFIAGKQQFPREWKCYIKYHKFARNVILKRARKSEMTFLSAWQAEFVAWTFVCVHWKPEMNILIKEWHKYGECSPQEEDEEEPSLKKVVAKYKEQRWPGSDEEDWIKLTDSLNEIQGIQKNWAKGFKEFEIKCRPNDPRTDVEFKFIATQSNIDAEEEERERWEDLYKCLDTVQDVYLKNLQIFQQFRFQCDARNLKVTSAQKVFKKQNY